MPITTPFEGTQQATLKTIPKFFIEEKTMITNKLQIFVVFPAKFLNIAIIIVLVQDFPEVVFLLFSWKFQMHEIYLWQGVL